MANDNSDDEYAQFCDDITPGELSALEALEQGTSSSDTTSLCTPISTSDTSAFEPPLTPDQTTVKRGAGRPKGSRNRNSSTSPKQIQGNKWPVGRPRGSGPRQLAKANGSAGSDDRGKKRVGRPRNNPAFGPSKPRNKSLFVHGLPPPGQFRRASRTAATATATGASTAPISAMEDMGGDSAPTSLVPPSRRDTDPEAPLVSSNNATCIIDDDDTNNAEGDEPFLEEGIGEDEADEGDDDDSGTRTSKVPLRDLPTWLKMAFDVHVFASGPPNRGPDRLPPLYRDHQTFWFPKPATFFLLQDINSLSPQNIYEAQFFLWDPECLVPGGIICPNVG